MYEVTKDFNHGKASYKVGDKISVSDEAYKVLKDNLKPVVKKTSKKEE